MKIGAVLTLLCSGCATTGAPKPVEAIDGVWPEPVPAMAEDVDARCDVSHSAALPRHAIVLGRAMRSGQPALLLKWPHEDEEENVLWPVSDAVYAAAGELSLPRAKTMWVGYGPHSQCILAVLPAPADTTVGSWPLPEASVPEASYFRRYPCRLHLGASNRAGISNQRVALRGKRIKNGHHQLYLTIPPEPKESGDEAGSELAERVVWPVSSALYLSLDDTTLPMWLTVWAEYDSHQGSCVVAVQSESGSPGYAPPEPELPR